MPISSPAPSIPSASPMDHRLAVERLTALWALAEAGLGGIMHAFRTPFVGLVVGGMAVMLLSLMASFTQNTFRTLLKATLVVLIIKAAVSPHSPPAAYVAVAFQGVLAACLYQWIPNFRLAALLFSVIALIETAFQRLLTLWILFGNSIWEAIDVFVDQALRSMGFIGQYVSVEASAWLVGTYLGIYLLGSVLIGWWSGLMPQELRQRAAQYAEKMRKAAPARPPEARARRGAGWKRWLLRAVVVVFVVGMIWLSETQLTPEAGKATRAFYLLLRTLLIIGLWYLLLAPLFMQLLRRYLSRKRDQYSEEVRRSLAVFPQLRRLAGRAWQLSQERRGLPRLRLFLTYLIAATLTFESEDEGASFPQDANA